MEAYVLPKSLWQRCCLGTIYTRGSTTSEHRTGLVSPELVKQTTKGEVFFVQRSPVEILSPQITLPEQEEHTAEEQPDEPITNLSQLQVRELIIHYFCSFGWDWCMSKQIWLTVARIPGLRNIVADRESRTSRRCTEWCLNRNLFLKSCKKLKFSPDIDLFASRIITRSSPLCLTVQTQKHWLLMHFTCHDRTTHFMPFRPLRHNKSSPPENATGEIRRTGTNSQVAHTSVVTHGNEDAHPSATNTTKGKNNTISPKQPKGGAPTSEQPGPGATPFIRQCLSSRGLSSGADRDHRNILESRY